MMKYLDLLTRKGRLKKEIRQLEVDRGVLITTIDNLKREKEATQRDVDNNFELICIQADKIEELKEEQRKQAAQGAVDYLAGILKIIEGIQNRL
jgi:hypothetical protein